MAFPRSDASSASDLAVALAILLTDPSCGWMRRSGWIAWGSLLPDGGVAAPQSSLVNDLPKGVYVGQIWHPDDHLPEPDEDAVMAAAGVTTLEEAWDALRFFADAEDVVFSRQHLRPRIAPALLRR